jgi:hypothetical protein
MSEQVTQRLENRCQVRPIETTDGAAQSAPTAPVSLPGRKPDAIALDAAYARTTGPQGAIIAEVLRLLAVWAVRAAEQGVIIAGKTEGSPRR